MRNIFRLCKTVCDRIGIRQAFKKSIENFLGQTQNKTQLFQIRDYHVVVSSPRGSRVAEKQFRMNFELKGHLTLKTFKLENTVILYVM